MLVRWKRLYVLITLLTLIFSQILPWRAQASLNLPAPGTLMTLSPHMEPPLLKGIKLFPDEPLRFDFLIDTGSSSDDLSAEVSSKLIKYFLTALTIPENDLWVNLSPYEQERIMTPELSITDMGRDLLAQDYLLKQVTASLIYPDKSLGSLFWEKVYQRSKELYGTDDIPVNTFNKVWIVPEKAVVHQHHNTAFVMESRLKVLLDTDYRALQENQDTNFSQSKNDVTDSIMREIILPILEDEVNNGEHFATLRQMYQSLILAVWFKRNFKESLLGQTYAEYKKTAGIEIDDPSVKEKVYQQYLEAFKVGAFNLIKDTYDPLTQTALPRKYFSGGTQFIVDPLLKNKKVGSSSLVNDIRKETTGRLHVASSVLEAVAENKENIDEQIPEQASSSTLVTPIVVTPEDRRIVLSPNQSMKTVFFQEQTFMVDGRRFQFIRAGQRVFLVYINNNGEKISLNDNIRIGSNSQNKEIKAFGKELRYFQPFGISNSPDLKNIFEWKDLYPLSDRMNFNQIFSYSIYETADNLLTLEVTNISEKKVTFLFSNINQILLHFADIIQDPANIQKIPPISQLEKNIQEASARFGRPSTRINVANALLEHIQAMQSKSDLAIDFSWEVLRKKLNRSNEFTPSDLKPFLLDRLFPSVKRIHLNALKNQTLNMVFKRHLLMQVANTHFRFMVNGDKLEIWKYPDGFGGRGILQDSISITSNERSYDLTTPIPKIPEFLMHRNSDGLIALKMRDSYQNSRVVIHLQTTHGILRELYQIITETQRASDISNKDIARLKDALIEATQAREHLNEEEAFAQALLTYLTALRQTNKMISDQTWQVLSQTAQTASDHPEVGKIMQALDEQAKRKYGGINFRADTLDVETQGMRTGGQWGDRIGNRMGVTNRTGDHIGNRTGGVTNRTGGVTPPLQGYKPIIFRLAPITDLSIYIK